MIFLQGGPKFEVTPLVHSGPNADHNRNRIPDPNTYIIRTRRRHRSLWRPSYTLNPFTTQKTYYQSIPD